MPYVTVDEIRAEAQNGAVASTQWDAIYDAVADVVTEAIDEYCYRTFTVPTSATARTFRPNRTATEVDDLDDIANTTGLAVATDTQQSGSYTALASTEWAAETDRTGRVVAIRSTGYFPYSAVRPHTIQVTARWGWPATPEPIKRAALLWALRLVDRRQTPSGVMGFGEYGGIRLGTIDPDVKALLAPWRRRGLLLR